ncbi:MAG TPA: hypothetical protein VIY86_00700, partial [Pirellulaceae bacterium]
TTAPGAIRLLLLVGSGLLTSFVLAIVGISQPQMIRATNLAVWALFLDLALVLTAVGRMVLHI